jgi:23S rRNA G2445 N2-methylase RlmL
MGNEFNENAAILAVQNIEKAGFSDCIIVDEEDCIDWDLGGDEEENSPARIVIPGRTIIVCNPPWGLRLDEDIEESWLSLKSFFRTQCNSAESWVLSGNKETTRFLRMKSSRKVVVKTADEDLRWIQYHVFKKKQVEDNTLHA